jgi:hypothetical protein
MLTSYLKIYPKRIFAPLNADGNFEGVFIFQLEQYGLQANDKKTDVKISQDVGEWHIWLQPFAGLETPQFKLFAESLNDYLFSVLKVIPGQDSKDSELPSVDMFFDNIYFDMSEQEPVIQKVSN